MSTKDEELDILKKSNYLVSVVSHLENYTSNVPDDIINGYPFIFLYLPSINTPNKKDAKFYIYSVQKDKKQIVVDENSITGVLVNNICHKVYNVPIYAIKTFILISIWLMCKNINYKTTHILYTTKENDISLSVNDFFEKYIPGAKSKKDIILEKKLFDISVKALVDNDFSKYNHEAELACVIEGFDTICSLFKEV